MARILMRAGKSPLTALSHEQSLATANAIFGGNSGNLLFPSAVHRHLSIPSTEIIPDGYSFERRSVSDAQIDEINEKYDHFVMPMANSFRPDFATNLHRLANVVSRLKIPVTVVGVGAQLETDATAGEISPDVREATKSFVMAVLDHSATIGVRGEITADVLRTLGFNSNSIDVIGCPSLFSNGRAAPMTAKRSHLETSARVAFNFTPYVSGTADFLDFNTRQYGDSVVVAQESRVLATMLWGDPPKSHVDLRLPIHTKHRIYEEDRLRFFVDAKTWIDYMADFDFVVGTRVHGTIAGVLAKTPSMLLTHDSRTEELAEYHGIPHTRFAGLSRDFDIKQLYEEMDLNSFERRRGPTFDAYLDFLDRNRLGNIFEVGKENLDYDESLTNLDLPGPVHTLMADGEQRHQQVIDRISWLRQGEEGDSSRRVYAHEPPIATRTRRIDGPEMADKIDALNTDVRELKKALRRQSAQIRKQDKLLRRQNAQLQPFKSSAVEQRIRKVFLRTEAVARPWVRTLRSSSRKLLGK